jgi:hypothetical protein
MALLMEPGAEPLTESEQADLAGIAAIKESAAREFKEQGNQFVRMGRKHYAEAVSCYTKAIAQMEPLPPSTHLPPLTPPFSSPTEHTSTSFSATTDGPSTTPSRPSASLPRASR